MAFSQFSPAVCRVQKKCVRVQTTRETAFMERWGWFLELELSQYGMVLIRYPDSPWIILNLRLHKHIAGCIVEKWAVDWVRTKLLPPCSLGRVIENMAPGDRRIHHRPSGIPKLFTYATPHNLIPHHRFTGSQGLGILSEAAHAIASTCV